MGDTTELKRWHAALTDARDRLLSVYVEGGAPEGLSTDSAFAFGEAIGVIAKAKALVRRDIDDAVRGETSAEPLHASGFR